MLIIVNWYKLFSSWLHKQISLATDGCFHFACSMVSNSDEGNSVQKRMTERTRFRCENNKKKSEQTLFALSSVYRFRYSLCMPRLSVVSLCIYELVCLFVRWIAFDFAHSPPKSFIECIMEIWIKRMKSGQEKWMPCHAMPWKFHLLGTNITFLALCMCQCSAFNLHAFVGTVFARILETHSPFRLCKLN